MAKVGRPRLSDEEKVKYKLIAIDKDVHNILKEKAVHKGVNMKDFIAGLVLAA